jgi:hypothetical protein
MNSIQYTIRNIPVPVDTALRSVARKKGVSFNSTVVEALEMAVGANGRQTRNTDFDWIIGSGLKDDSFDESMQWLNKLPKDIN